jgi:uncharacterized repeat protein (TIGR03833 family)
MQENRDGRLRSSIHVGTTVELVRKQARRTGKRTRGVVAEILTSSASHPHGIKVRLRDGTVGRVVEILGDGEDLS